jgi:hypothetical protein
MQSEVEQLKRDRLLLLKEVMRLRETSAHTAEEVRTLSSRLAQTEAMQQQMLGFLQQHISPTLFNANSHLLQGRKRRHLLLAPVSPRSRGALGDDDDELLLDGGMGMPIPGGAQQLQQPQAYGGGGGGGGGGDDTYLLSGVPMVGAMEGLSGPGGALFPAGSSPVAGASRVFLRELPDEGARPYALHAPALAASSAPVAHAAQQQPRQQLPPPLGADALMPSYNALLPPPPLPDVLQLPDGTAEGDIFSWSDLLADLPAGSSAPSGVPAGLPGGADAAWDAGGLHRMNSADINAIVRDMQLDAAAPPGVTGGGGVVVR